MNNQPDNQKPDNQKPDSQKPDSQKLDSQKLDSQNSNIETTGAQGASVGNQLREAREQLGLSVNDVANRIKFAPKQIEWLEADDYVRLPEAAFVRGFVRSYARLVELDPAGLLASLPTSHAQTSSAPEMKSVEIAMPSPLSARRHNIVWLAAALVVALSLAIFERMQDGSPAKSGDAAKTNIQVLELPAAAPESGAALSPEQAQKPEAELAQADKKPQAAPVVATPQPVIRQPVQVTPVPVAAPKPPVVTEAARTAPIALTAPAPVAEAKPAPVAKPVPVVKPAPAPAPQPVAEETEQPKPDSSFSFSNFFKRSAAPADDVGQPKPEVSATPSPEVPVKPAPVTAVPEHALRLEFDEDAWVEIKDSTGKVLISKMHTAGGLVRVASKLPLDVTIGNAKAVRMFDKGKKINLERYTTAEVAHIQLK